jgi:16S rRNA (guanine527-N7)-methyltransferase
MDELLRRCHIYLTDDQLKQLWAYHQFLRRHDDELNLTRIRNFDNMVVKLYADSILPALHVTLPSPLLDLGTGPGMPGIPLKIFRPDLRILLAESRQPRIAFLKAVVAMLDLNGLEVVERGIAPDFDRPVAGVITRAVEPMADTLIRVGGCLAENGMAIFMKGPHCDSEIAAVLQHVSYAYRPAGDIPYRIAQTPHQRRLVLFQRTSPPAYSGSPPTHPIGHRIKVIESAGNPTFKDLKKLLTGRGVKKQGQTLVFGTRLTSEALQKSAAHCLAWITSGSKTPPPSDAPAALTWLQLAPELFRELDPFGTRSPIILYAIPAIERWPMDAASLSGCSLLVPFQDPENVGAVIRTAMAFSVDRIVMLAESANPFHPKAVRASAGSVFSAMIVQGPSLSDIPPDLPMVALAPTGRLLVDLRFPPSFCLLAGMEGPGLPAEWRPHAVAIPMAAGIDSLNAAVAVGIALYEWRRTLAE